MNLSARVLRRARGLLKRYQAMMTTTKIVIWIHLIFFIHYVIKNIFFPEYAKRIPPPSSWLLAHSSTQNTSKDFNWKNLWAKNEMKKKYSYPFCWIHRVYGVQNNWINLMVILDKKLAMLCSVRVIVPPSVSWIFQNNTSLAAKGALAHRLQRRTYCNAAPPATLHRLQSHTACNATPPAIPPPPA